MGGVASSFKVAQINRIISVAYHEAGHAICGLLHYMEVFDIKINELKRGVSGETKFNVLFHDHEYDKLDGKIKDYLVNAEILQQFSGLSAEKLYFKDLSGSDIFPSIMKEGTESDFHRASEIIAKHNLAEPGSKRYQYKKKMFHHTTNLLKDYWSDIKLVAHLLYKTRRVYYSDLKKTLCNKSVNKKFWKKQFKNIELLHSENENINIDTAMFILFK